MIYFLVIIPILISMILFFYFIRINNKLLERIDDLETKIDDLENDYLKNQNKDFWLNNIIK